jgi:hypothetical protein
MGNGGSEGGLKEQLADQAMFPHIITLGMSDDEIGLHLPDNLSQPGNRLFGIGHAQVIISHHKEFSVQLGC